MNRSLARLCFATFLASLAWPSWAAAQVQTDPDLPHYVAGEEELSGKLTLIGSDALNNMVAVWADRFTQLYPNVDVQIRQKGASTPVGGLLGGGADFGMSTWELTNRERAELQTKLGSLPTEITVAADMTAIFVHRDNPLASLSMDQVDAIFSSTRKGGKADITEWRQLLPPTAPTAKLPIQLYGRNSATQVYGQMKKQAIRSGDFKTAIKEMPGSAALLQAIAKDPAGCGYAGIGYATAEVRAVPLTVGEQSIAPTPENLDRYPLTKKLRLIYVVPPGEALDPLRREFLKYALSREGQAAVLGDGYLPLPAAVVKKLRTEANLDSANE
ncbi:substrate-binding domain-containing protein [Blastopirellula marina]|uniref:Phosphate-binding protein n=1 Tax=Blastopirellula marina TaxID=124 RepID=A0A2S8GFN8_9BACT|nr:substrate-binding domain-containing protein [Blastopirellula marina]PQO43278.1 phosphate-binding protein [Blastopirellula marina]